MSTNTATPDRTSSRFTADDRAVIAAALRDGLYADHVSLNDDDCIDRAAAAIGLRDYELRDDERNWIAAQAIDIRREALVLDGIDAYPDRRAVTARDVHRALGLPDAELMRVADALHRLHAAGVVDMNRGTHVLWSRR